MSASEKDLNNLGHAHSGSNTPGNTAGGHVASQDVSGVTYYSHSQSQVPVTLQHTPHIQHVVPNASSSNPKPQSSQKPTSTHKPQSVILPANQKPKQAPTRIAPSQPTTIKPSATTNAPPKSAPTPTPPGSSAVMAAVMAQAQAAAGQAVAAQQAKQQTPNTQTQGAASSPAHPTPSPAPPPVPGQPAPQPYPYPYPYYLPPGQPGAPPYLYPGAPGAPAFLPPGAPTQGGAPPPGYPYVYPVYPAPIPVPQTSPVPAAKEKKSQRTYQACQKCRQWKAKCNGLKPCNHCQKRGVPCEYAERRNMPGPGEASSSDPPAAPSSPDGTSSKVMDIKPPSQESSTAQAAPATTEAASPPQPQQIQPQPQPQVAPPAASPPHQGQPQHPPPMAMYPPPPPGYAYPPQLYPGMFPPPPGDPNVPYAHFISMQYPQPYGPYIWGPPPPPPGHEPAPAANPTDGEEGERDADGKLKIKRTFQACQKCRQRKAKCNGARPSCQHCTSRGLTCEYAKERSKPRGPNGEEEDESPSAQHAEPPTTMDPSQATINADPASSGAPSMPPNAPPTMFPPPFQYDPNAYNPHVDPQQHGGQPMYPFPPYPYGHPPAFGTVAGPPLVHIGEEGAMGTYHPTMAPPVPVSGSQPSAASSGSSSKRPRAARPPGVPGSGKARIFQACERCRERKAKCDGARPVCSHCATRDLNCEWAGKRRMRGPAKGITPRRNRAEHTFIAKGPMDMNAPMPTIPIGLSTAGLQTIEQHPLPMDSPRKRKRRSSHSSASPSPSSSSSSSESSPSESDDDDQHGGIGTGHDGMSVVTAAWS